MDEKLSNFSRRVCEFLWFEGRPKGLGKIVCTETSGSFTPKISDKDKEEFIVAYGLRYIKRIRTGNIHISNNATKTLYFVITNNEGGPAIKFMSPTSRRYLL